MHVYEEMVWWLFMHGEIDESQLNLYLGPSHKDWL